MAGQGGALIAAQALVQTSAQARGRDSFETDAAIVSDLS